VKDQVYWDLCNKAINELPPNIQVVYHGAIPPDEVTSALEKIQLFILPSKSENFGHAIFEALSAGKPVITTNTTPFIDLNHKKAGYTLSINNLQSQLIQAINDFAEMDQITFSQYQNNATLYATNFINIEKLKNQYLTMFSATN
jgi:glycosyltransferase involved in cell wall biosynthesis